MRSGPRTPPAYVSALTPQETERAIRLIKEFFQTNLAFELNLMGVTAPIVVRAGTGVNDDLNGVEKPVSFPVRGLDGERAEIVQSLAKWKRMALAQLGVPHGHARSEGVLECQSDHVLAPADCSRSRGDGRRAGGAFGGALAPFWIDKWEVTNRQFKNFVDRGGYQTRDYWPLPFLRGGRTVPWEEAHAAFRDRTGRPGPSTWEVGTYRDGEADFPVGGVSWYEAAAYCRSVGRALPTVHHWEAAALFAGTTEFAVYSRFGATGPAPVGAPRSLGYFGTYDMAGNVKEWTWNSTGPNERRLLLGGSWTEPGYMFSKADAQHPFERQANYGFRCAKYDGPLPQSLLEPVKAIQRDFRREKPADDRTFAVLESLYHYERLPLDAKVEATFGDLNYARVAHVSFAAAYGSERVPALVFLPKVAAPPFQAVLYLPGLNVLFEPGPAGLVEREQRWFLFLVRSGRAVVVPVYKGSFGRKLPAFKQLWGGGTSSSTRRRTWDEPSTTSKPGPTSMPESSPSMVSALVQCSGRS